MFTGIFLERTTGIEPAFPAWEAGVLPLNHIRTEEIQLFYYTRFPSVCKAQNKNFPDFFSKSLPKAFVSGRLFRLQKCFELCEGLREIGDGVLNGLGRRHVYPGDPQQVDGMAAAAGGQELPVVIHRRLSLGKDPPGNGDGGGNAGGHSQEMIGSATNSGP